MLSTCLVGVVGAGVELIELDEGEKDVVLCNVFFRAGCDASCRTATVKIISGSSMRVMLSACFGNGLIDGVLM